MRRMLLAVASVLGMVSVTIPASAQRVPRAEAGLSMMVSPTTGSRIPELMAGPMVNVTIAEAAGGLIGVEGAMRFRADGTQLVVCPQPPGVICDARNVKTLTTAGLTYRRGFGAEPLRRGAMVRAGVGGAFTSLKGTATIYPFSDGTRPPLADVQKSAGVVDVGLGWVQRMGTVPLRVEGRVAGFVPELASTKYVYGVQFGLGY